MQLSGLLARLTVDERATLLERRLGPNAVSIDEKALASRLAHPGSVAEALAQLNVAQLLMLRWLSTRPNLQAAWTELLDALGDRLPAELRDAYLSDLRLWGLADYDPRQRGGFFATYPAVIAALPSQRGVNLERRLSEMNSDVLMKMCSALGLKNPPTRKEDRLKLLMGVLAQPEAVQSAVQGLPRPVRELFDWVREQGGWVGLQQMLDRVPSKRRGYGTMYGSMGSWWTPLPRGETLDPLSELVRRGLVLPISPYPGGWYAPSAFAIAEEVELAFAGRTLFDSAPLQPPPLEPAEQVDGVIPNPANVLRDLGHLLGFVGAGRCEWRQDGEPYKRSLVAFGKLLGRKDATYAELLWNLAISARLIRRTRAGATGQIAVGQLDATPRELLGGLLLGWVEAAGRSVQGGGSPAVALDARARLLQFLALMPTDSWILKRSAEAWLRFTWPVTFAPGYQYRQGAPPDPDWSSLGNLVLARGTTPDGQDAIMLPDRHRQAMLSGATENDSALPPWDENWTIQPDRSIVAPPNLHPNAQRELWQVAQLESSQGASVFRVTAASISAALNRNLTPTEIRTLLEKRSRVPLPPTVERLIEDQAQRYGRIKVGTAYTYVKTDEPALLDELRRDSKLKKLDWRDVAPGVAFIVSADPTSVLQTLRGAGYLPVMEQSTSQQAPVQVQRGPERSIVAPGDVRNIVRVVNQAIEDVVSLSAIWSDGEREIMAELEPIDLHQRELHAYNLDDDQEVIIPFDAIVELTIGDQLDDPLDDPLRLILEDEREPTW